MIRHVLALVLAMLASAAAAAGRGPDIAEGMQWLHSFEYERALAAFQRAERNDRRDAMAYWGQAMCYQQLLWGNENVGEARAILARMTRNGALTDAAGRERAWIDTLGRLFGDGDRPSRLDAYAAAVGRLAETYPDDPDAAAFHGLAIMATRARGLAGHHATDQEVPQLVGSEEQKKAAQIFVRILEKHPRHPGALHYLIHVWDDPKNAHKALDAARAYGAVVPESSHARHMPAHVFLQLGMWDEAIAADAGAAAAADAKVKADGLPVTATDFHPLSWLVYEYTQAGRIEDAKAALGRLEDAARSTRDPRLLSLAASLRSRVAIEAEDWQAAAGPGFANYDELFAVGFSAARRGDLSLAERARSRLGELAREPRYAARRALLEIMAIQVGAAIRSSQGDREGALTLLAEAAKQEAALPDAIGPPPLIKPAGEQYAEQLLESGRHGEARRQFEAVLSRTRNRRLSVEGLARARAGSVESPAGLWRSWTALGLCGTLVLVALVAWRRRTRTA
jgi:hypothetical protein